MMDSRKGSVLDIIFFSGGLVALGLVIILVSMMLGEFKTEIEQSDVPMNTTYIDKGLTSLSVFDYSFVIIIVAVGAAAVISSFLIDTHPAFFVFFFMLGIVLTFISAQFTNVWYEFATADSMAGTVSNFPMMHTVLMHLPTIELAISALVAIAMFGKAYFFG